MRYSVEVTAISENGDKIPLGNVWVCAENRSEARWKAIDALWEPRLSSASCKAKTKVIGSLKQTRQELAAARKQPHISRT